MSTPNTTNPNAASATQDAMTDAQHTEELIKNRAATVKPRARMEVSIIRRTIRALAAAGYALTVDDGGEEDEQIRSDDERKLLAAVMSVDTATLLAATKTKGTFVSFVMGNDGYDVIADYSTSLESVIADVLAYAERLADGGVLEDGEPAGPDLLEANRLSLKNVESMINALPIKCDPYERQSLETWASIIRAAIVKAEIGTK